MLPWRSQKQHQRLSVRIRYDGISIPARKLAAKDHLLQFNLKLFSKIRNGQRLTADATPANPKKGAKGGQTDMVVQY